MDFFLVRFPRSTFVRRWPIYTRASAKMTGGSNSPASLYFCMTRARRVHVPFHVSHTFWQSVALASPYGKIASTICRTIVWPDQHSIPCACQLVSFLYFIMKSFRPTTSMLTSIYLFADHTKVIGFSFDSNQAARDIWSCIERLISDPENISLSVPGRKRKQSKRPKPAPLPQKSQISQPCQFSHVTSVTTNDSQRYFSMQTFVGHPLNHREP